MERKCLWCLKTACEVTFEKKAHTIPLSLGGDRYNRNVCDSCNSYFGNKQEVNYSIEEALKETFNITRRRLLMGRKSKKQVGAFKSRFFDIRERNGKPRLVVKPSFRLNGSYQRELCYYFKRGLYKMYLEEFNRQNPKEGFEEKYNFIRNFARYGLGQSPVLYFKRKVGIIAMFDREAETPVLYFNRMKYLFSNDKFVEIEFLGHVFGFAITLFDPMDFDNYIEKSLKEKRDFFSEAIVLKHLTEIDLTLSIMNS
ncbi:MAG TPA: HNH endonuclease [Aequorivita sp.]|nr:HNH endonuclease [Aequorivita sp.]